MNRPDFMAIGGYGAPWIPNASDEEVLMEAFAVAVYNSRSAVVEYMVSRGFPVDSCVWDMPMLAIAVGNGWLPTVECLLQCGASLDVEGSSNGSARQMAKSMIENGPTSTSETYRRIAMLCGLDPDAVLEERNARPLPKPTILPWVEDAFLLAMDDALRLGQTTVLPDNLLFGMLRLSTFVAGFMKASDMDFERFRVDFLARVKPGIDRLNNSTLPMHPDTHAIVATALDFAAEHRSTVMRGDHLLYALTRTENGAVATLLKDYGANVGKLTEKLQRSMC